MSGTAAAGVRSWELVVGVTGYLPQRTRRFTEDGRGDPQISGFAQIKWRRGMLGSGQVLAVSDQRSAIRGNDGFNILARPG